jgi:hypothetical protein
VKLEAGLLGMATIRPRLGGQSPYLRQQTAYNPECVSDSGFFFVAAKLLSKDEARRIAVNIAKLPGLVQKVV